MLRRQIMHAVDLVSRGQKMFGQKGSSGACPWAGRLVQESLRLDHATDVLVQEAYLERPRSMSVTQVYIAG